MKKNLFLGILIIMISALCACNNTKDKKYSYFSDIDTVKIDNISNVLYDESDFYIDYGEFLLFYNEQLGMCYCCDDITCSHTTAECKAYIGMDSFFVFNNNLYICKNYGDKYGEIYKINNKREEELVFTNDLNKDIEKYSCSNHVHVLNDEYICSYSGAGAYLMDKNFNVIHTYDFCAAQTRGVIYGDKYYYTNIAEVLCEFDLNTKTVKEITEISASGVWSFEIYKDTLYYTNKFFEFVKVDLNDYSREFICDLGGMINCIVDDKVIVKSYEKNGFTIYDLSGNKVYEYDKGNEDETYYTLCYKNDKLYFFASDRVVKINTDGTDCEEKLF